MKEIYMGKIAAIATLVAVACSMTACTSLQSQMNSYDSDIRSKMDDGQWNSAKRIIDTAQFKCEPSEKAEVDAWRTREHIQMKSAFAKTLQPTVDKARELYLGGAFTEGEKVRQSLKEKYYGGQGGSEPAKLLSLKLFDAGAENGVPECLAPCIELAWIQMLSDRNIARMITAYKGYLKQAVELDVNGGKKSIKQFDSIAAGYKKVEKWKDKIDLFMEKLADPEVRRWTPIDRSQYALVIKKMEAARDEFLKVYRTKRWNTRVLDRKQDYKRVAEMTAAQDYDAAMQVLSAHDWIIQPIGLEGALDFDDQAERAKVASSGLGEYQARQIAKLDTGVRYHRYDVRRSMISALVVGRAHVDDTRDRRKLREAGRVAQMQARSEFVRYLGTSISAVTQQKASEVDDEFHQSFSSENKEVAEAEVSNLVVLATGVDGEDVVIVLGWRSPDLGMITPAPMHRVEGGGNFTVSPSVGAYL